MGANFTSRQAYAIALREAGLEAAEAGLVSIKQENGFYELTVEAQEMMYEFYVGAKDGFVYGINAEPLGEENCDLAYSENHMLIAA